MAIPDSTGYLYNRGSIEQNAPSASGVYAIYNKAQWIYVGESNNIKRRLLEHFAEVGTCIPGRNPTGFQFELLNVQVRVTRQNELIRALRPSCNQILG